MSRARRALTTSCGSMADSASGKSSGTAVKDVGTKAKKKEVKAKGDSKAKGDPKTKGDSKVKEDSKTKGDPKIKDPLGASGGASMSENEVGPGGHRCRCPTRWVPEESSSSGETRKAESSYLGPADLEKVRLGLLELHPYTRYRIKRDLMLKEENMQPPRPFWRGGGGGGGRDRTRPDSN